MNIRKDEDMETVSLIIAIHNIITTIIVVVSLALVVDGVGDNETIMLRLFPLWRWWWSDKLRRRCKRVFVGFQIKSEAGRRTRSGRREFDAYLRLITNEYTCQFLRSCGFQRKGEQSNSWSKKEIVAFSANFLLSV